ncbi:hypothetical protein WDW37_08145 [Bdellovibrionota bacterium FG-1]
MIVGFADGELRPDEISPILNTIERKLGDQKGKYLGLRFTQKVVTELVWNNDVARDYGMANGYDDIVLVSLSLHLTIHRNTANFDLGSTGVSGNSYFKSMYLNVQTGDSELVKEEQEKDSSHYGGEVGKVRVREPLIDNLTSMAKKSPFPELAEQPTLVKILERSPASIKTRVAIAPAKLVNVPNSVQMTLPGFLADSVGNSPKFSAVSRNFELDAVLKEQSTGVSQAFNQETVIKVGKLSGASMLLMTEMVCEANQCILNISLVDLQSGESLKTVNKETDPQLASVKLAIKDVISTLESIPSLK